MIERTLPHWNQAIRGEAKPSPRGEGGLFGFQKPKRSDEGLAFPQEAELRGSRRKPLSVSVSNHLLQKSQNKAPPNRFGDADFYCNTKFPLNALTNLLTENFVERGGRRRQAGACQGGQRSYTEFNAINVKVF